VTNVKEGSLVGIDTVYRAYIYIYMRVRVCVCVCVRRHTLLDTDS